MLCKLAWGNVRRAGRDYLVYLLTLTFAVIMFYAFNTISMQIDYAGIDNADMAEFLGGLIRGVTIFLAFVMGFLMVYANNFIMKRRKKEFGLYQVLGMGRGQVARIMALETLLVSATALVLGIVFGVALSQVMTFFTASLFKTQIANFRFFFSTSALLMTVACLAVIFLVTLVFNLRVVARAKIADLMGAGRVNEAIKVRNPWIAAILFVVGIALVGVAYARLLEDGLPLGGTTEQFNAFLITTGIVIAGTLLLFFGLSGFLLRILAFMRGLYWRGLNMFTLRQLAAKVNTVSLSMAVIAMILFLAITSVTGGMSIVNAMNTAAESSCPADFSMNAIYAGNRVVAADGTSETEWVQVTEPLDLMKNVRDESGASVDMSRIVGSSTQVNAYSSTPIGEDTPQVTLLDLLQAIGRDLPAGMEYADVVTQGIMLVRQSDFNAYLAFRGKDAIDLGEDGYLITSDMGTSVADIYRTTMGQGVPLTLNGNTLHPVTSNLAEERIAFSNAQVSNSGSIVVPDRVIDESQFPVETSYLLANYREGLSVEEGDKAVEDLSYSAEWTPREDGRYVAFMGLAATRTSIYESTNSMNGMVSYLAIYIGFVLVISCAAILTIQQLSGVSDASPSCRVLSELGTPRRQIMHSVLTQQTIFFLFPLIVGLAHSMIALRVVVRMVELLGGVSIGSIIGLAVLIFVLAYGGYFLVTYLMSKAIVRDAIRARRRM
ncbi:FtsX-like permease family protein [Collinsella vaginalis]|uniref:FtsX-like permease family protein n=1 Tax=Collinsella vaginalis TaxID=1870987 RepID=UPI000A26DC91|nr:FtsX-like permease family protein [Collinsella vaginalis]